MPLGPVTVCVPVVCFVSVTRFILWLIGSVPAVAVQVIVPSLKSWSKVYVTLELPTLNPFDGEVLVNVGGAKPYTTNCIPDPVS